MKTKNKTITVNKKDLKPKTVASARRNGEKVEVVLSGVKVKSKS